MDSKVIEAKAIKFVFANQKVLFTYKTHIDKKKITEFFNGLNNGECKFIRAAHETGDENHNYDHTHILVDFGKKFQTKNVRLFDFEDIHPHINTMKTITHFKNARAYLAKEDIANADLKEPVLSVIERVWSHNTVQDAMINNVARLADVSGVVAAFKLKPQQVCEQKIVPRPWQAKAKEYSD